MAVPTEVLDDDIKDLRGDIREVRNKVDFVKDEVCRIGLAQADARGEARIIKVLLGLIVTCFLASGVEFFRLESRVKTVESKLDKVESKLDKLIEQTKPAQPPRGE